MNIHFIQQDDWVAPGAFGVWAQARGYAVSMTRCWQFEPVPETVDADFLIVLGGFQCPATTRRDCAYFDAEAQKALIRRYAAAGKMVLGVCLGAQLLGEALGAPYAHSPEREVGPVPAWLTAAGRADPLFAGFPDEFLAGAWHSDMPGLTPKSAVLAESAGCPRQIVRYGPLLYGFQTHMELTHEIVADGVREAAGTLRGGGRFIQTPEQLLAFDYTEMNALLCSFLDALVERYRQSRA